MKRHRLLKAALALCVSAVASAAHAAWPERPITMLVAWGAGGGTDATARIVATLLEKELGQPVNVVNRTGGNGVVGHAAIASAKPDGYTLGMLTVEIAMMRHLGLTKLTPADYTPLALMNVDPAAVSVSAASPYKTMGELMDAIKANPGKLKASGTGRVASGISQSRLAQESGLAPCLPSAFNWRAPAMLNGSRRHRYVPRRCRGALMIDAGKARRSRHGRPGEPMYPSATSKVRSQRLEDRVWRGIAAKGCR